MGAVITHVDNFTLAEMEDFIKEVLETINRELTISEIEKNNFRYTWMDISMVKYSFKIQMEDYVDKSWGNKGNLESW